MKSFRLLLGCYLLSLAFGVQSAAVNFVPQVEFEVDYVDNIDLAKSGGRDDLVAQINPEFLLEVASSRIEVQADYRLQNLVYTSYSDLNETYQQFHGNAAVDIIPSKLKLNSIASYDQQIISFDRPTGTDNLTGADNTTNRGILGLSPVWTTNVTDRLIAEVSAGYYRVTDETDSDSYNYGITIYPFANKSPLDWRITGNLRDVDYDNHQARDSSRGAVSFAYPLTNSLSAVSEIGYESDEFDNVLFTRSDSGSIFIAGLTWLRKGEVTINLNYENHYYGNFGSGSVYFKRSRMAYKLSYTEDVTTDLDQDIGNLTGGGDSIPSPVEGDSTGIFLQKTFQASATYFYERGSIDLGARLDKRRNGTNLFIPGRLINPDEDFLELNANWSHQLTLRHVLTMGILKRDRDVSRGSHDKDYIFNTALDYQINPMLSGKFFYTSNQRNSNFRNSEYDSSIVGASINVLF